MKFGFLGSGKMAGALAEGAAKSGAIAAGDLFFTDSLPKAADDLAARTGGQALPGNRELAEAVDVIVLCVKPGDVAAALSAVQAELAGKLVISIAAGLSTATLATAAGTRARIIRVMPNTPALVHRGATAFAAGPGATDEDAATATRLFGAVGTVCQVKEALLDVVTGLSGSGPAYVYLAIEALADGAVRMGLPRDLALQLAAQTVAGSAEMVLQTGQHPAVLRDMVTSPGGTTIAGIEALEQAGVRAGFIAAVRAATERAAELGAK